MSGNGRSALWEDDEGRRVPLEVRGWHSPEVLFPSLRTLEAVLGAP